jgi:hypothetical protein
MDVKNFYMNYATLKRRGYDDNYTYIYTVHKYPVRMPGYEDVDFLKSVNSRLEFGNTDDEIRFASSIARSRSKVLQLGCNNKWDYFVTLTVSPESVVDRYNLKEITKSLLKFFNNYQQRRSSDFKYLVIPEKHKDGAYHFHGFFVNINPEDLVTNEYGYLDFAPYCKKYGFCSMSPIKDAVACASYVSKYITKDMFSGTIPEPRTHLYYSSRGLKYDEILSVGSASAADSFCDDSYTASSSPYCTRYFCDRDIFSKFIIPFENVNTAPELPKNEYINYFRKRVLYGFCNKNNIPIGDKTDLMVLYSALKDEIISNSLTEYEYLKQYYAVLRHQFDTEDLTSEDIAKLDTLFDLSFIDDVITDTEPSVEPCQLPLWSE